MSSRTWTFVLLAVLAVLMAFVAIAPDGPMGFLQGIVEEKDASSIVILASLMGIAFVLLHRSSMSSYENEAETPTQ
ncbi:MAG TPA: hypothetical protein VIE86_03140 [Nitrososphaera sp.]